MLSLVVKKLSNMRAIFLAAIPISVSDISILIISPALLMAKLKMPPLGMASLALANHVEEYLAQLVFGCVHFIKVGRRRE